MGVGCNNKEGAPNKMMSTLLGPSDDCLESWLENIRYFRTANIGNVGDTISNRFILISYALCCG